MTKCPASRDGETRGLKFAKNVFFGVLVSLAVLGLISLGEEVIDLLSQRPQTVTIDENNPDRPVRVYSFYDGIIMPEFHKACYRSRWSKWYREVVFGEKCVQLSFNPNSLRDMYTKRAPMEFSGTPVALLRQFVSEHSHCMELIEHENTFHIGIPKDSKLEEKDGMLICP